MNVVMKFGGTSVADAEAMNRVIAIVRRQLEANPADEAAGRRRVGDVEGDRPTRRGRTPGRGRATGDQAAPASGRPAASATSTVARRSGVRRRTGDAARPRSNEEFSELDRDGPVAGGAARGVAAFARRDARDGRAGQQPHRRRRVRDRGSIPASWVDARHGPGHRRRAHGGGARHGRDMPANARARRRANWPPGAVAGLGGFIGATPDGRDDDARARRLGLFGGDLRRLSRRGRDPDLDRCGRHADRRSARRVRSAARAAALVCRSVGAGVLRREGAAPEHDSAGRREEHPGSNPQLAAPGGDRHADHRRRARSAAPP